jgi:hypothetical protein
MFIPKVFVSFRALELFAKFIDFFQVHLSDNINDLSWILAVLMAFGGVSQRLDDLLSFETSGERLWHSGPYFVTSDLRRIGSTASLARTR